MKQYLVFSWEEGLISVRSVLASSEQEAGKIASFRNRMTDKVFYVTPLTNGYNGIIPVTQVPKPSITLFKQYEDQPITQEVK